MRGTAEQALYYIYDSPHINRLFTEDYIELVRASGLKGRIQRTFPTPCPVDIKRRLQTLYPGKASFENNGLLFVLTF